MAEVAWALPRLKSVSAWPVPHGYVLILADLFSLCPRPFTNKFQKYKTKKIRSVLISGARSADLWRDFSGRGRAYSTVRAGKDRTAHV